MKSPPPPRGRALSVRRAERRRRAGVPALRGRRHAGAASRRVAGDRPGSRRRRRRASADARTCRRVPARRVGSHPPTRIPWRHSASPGSTLADARRGRLYRCPRRGLGPAVPARPISFTKESLDEADCNPGAGRHPGDERIGARATSGRPQATRAGRRCSTARRSPAGARSRPRPRPRAGTVKDGVLARTGKGGDLMTVARVRQLRTRTRLQDRRRRQQRHHVSRDHARATRRTGAAPSTRSSTTSGIPTPRTGPTACPAPTTTSSPRAPPSASRRASGTPRRSSSTATTSSTG